MKHFERHLGLVTQDNSLNFGSQGVGGSNPATPTNRRETAHSNARRFS
jgi:hypothetical protein